MCVPDALIHPFGNGFLNIVFGGTAPEYPPVEYVPKEPYWTTSPDGRRV